MPRPKKTGKTTELPPPPELTASYGDVLTAAKIARCSIHLDTTHLAIVQDGNPGNSKMFEKSQQGLGQAILWMNDLAPVTDTIKSISETALFYALNSLTLRLNIEPVPASSFYSWEVLDQKGEATSFLEAMKKAINVLMQEYIKLTEQEKV
jgi:hypothetical protein